MSTQPQIQDIQLGDFDPSPFSGLYLKNFYKQIKQTNEKKNQKRIQHHRLDDKK